MAGRWILSLAKRHKKVCQYGNLFVSSRYRYMNPMSGREFISSLPDKARKKITYNLLKLEGGEMDRELFKKLENSDIWELRTLFDGICYRLFAFWDTRTETLVVATHGIVKKSQKTPKKEIEKAEALRKEYFNDKNK